VAGFVMMPFREQHQEHLDADGHLRLRLDVPLGGFHSEAAHSRPPAARCCGQVAAHPCIWCGLV
jgi:hypothetical protein